MGCAPCQNESEHTKFMPPTKKTYFIFKEDYEKYLELQKFNRKCRSESDINAINSLSQDSLYPKKSITIEDQDKYLFNSVCSQNLGALIREVSFIHETYNNINYPNLEIKCYALKNPKNIKNQIVLLQIRNKCYEKYERKKREETAINYYYENNYFVKENNNMEGGIEDILKNNEFDDSFISDKPEKKKKKMTIVVSHSNESDLGTIFPSLCYLSTATKCDVISYDYTGYGNSFGKPNYNSLMNDLTLVMDFCTDSLSLKKEEIILLGVNIGAIPSINVAAMSPYCTVRGLVLVSPRLDFLCRFKTECLDDVICPVFIIIGNLENSLDEDSISLKRKFRESICWIVKGGRNFTDILEGSRSKFIMKLKKFMDHVQSTRMKVSQKIADSREQSITGSPKERMSKLIEKKNNENKERKSTKIKIENGKKEEKKVTKEEKNDLMNDNLKIEGE